MKCILITLFALVTSLSFAQTTGKFTGFISDNVTNQPIIGAKLSLNEKNNASVKRVMSDLDGKFEVANLPYGTYSLVISVLTFDTVRATIKIDKAIVTQNFVMGGSQEDRKSVV